MKQTQSYQQEQEIEKVLELLAAKEELSQKTRINLYLPKVIVKLMDVLGKNVSRGELVSSLVIKEIKKKQQLPYGMFSPLEISKKEIDKISSAWGKTIDEIG
mgnify:CR=1 FL=1